MASSIKAPTLDEMGEMPLSTLEFWRTELEPHYANRFNLEVEDYIKIMYYYPIITTMIRNINAGLDRWKGIK